VEGRKEILDSGEGKPERGSPLRGCWGEGISFSEEKEKSLFPNNHGRSFFFEE